MNRLKQTVHESQARLCYTSIKFYIHEISGPTTKYESKNDFKKMVYTKLFPFIIGLCITTENVLKM